MKFIKKIFGKSQTQLSLREQKKKMLVDLKQQAVSRFGAEQIQRLVEQGLSIPVMAL
jgi:hypothetical protein